MLAKRFCTEINCTHLLNYIELKMEQLIAQLPEDYSLPVSCASVYDCFTFDEFTDHYKLILWYNKPSGTTSAIIHDIRKECN